MSWVLAGVGFAALIILHELGHFVAAKSVGMRVERFSLFFPPTIARLRRGETEYAIGAIPLGGYVKISGMSPHEELAPEVAPRAYLRQPVWKRVVVIAAGPAVNLLIAFVIFWALLAARGMFVNDVVVDTVTPGSASAGVLHPGDKILAIDGVRGWSPGLSEDEAAKRQNALRAAVSSDRCPDGRAAGCHAAEPVTVTVKRGARILHEKITPRYDPQVGRMLLGITYGRAHDLGAGGAVSQAGTTMWRITHETVTAIVRVFYSEQARKGVSGVVGSYEATRQSFQFDTTRALGVLGVISLSLAVVNLFPFLPLDGGHIFWAVAEKVRGRPIPYRVMERASVVGFMLVAFLFVVGLTNDIGRLTGPGFNVR